MSVLGIALIGGGLLLLVILYRPNAEQRAAS
jgi:hypothetical protein